MLVVLARMDADLAALRGQALHRLLNGKHVAEAVASVADGDAAAGPDLAQRAETMTAVDRRLRRRAVPRQQRERRDHAARTGRRRTVEQLPRCHQRGRVRPRRDDPVVARHAGRGERRREAGLAERDRAADVHRMVDGVALAAAGPHPQEEVGRSLVDADLTAAWPAGVAKKVCHAAGTLAPTWIALLAGSKPLRTRQKQALRFGRLLAIVEQRAPAQQLDRHAGERPAELVARQREKHDLARIAVGVVGRPARGRAARRCRAPRRSGRAA